MLLVFLRTFCVTMTLAYKESVYFVLGLRIIHEISSQRITSIISLIYCFIDSCIHHHIVLDKSSNDECILHRCDCWVIRGTNTLLNFPLLFWFPLFFSYTWRLNIEEALIHFFTPFSLVAGFTSAAPSFLIGVAGFVFIGCLFLKHWSKGDLTISIL